MIWVGYRSNQREKKIARRYGDEAAQAGREGTHPAPVGQQSLIFSGKAVYEGSNVSLTEKWLRENLGRRVGRVRERSDQGGLSARVSALGKIVFQMRYVCNGVPRRLDLGVYPEMTLETARAENERLRKHLTAGRDPKLVRLSERKARLPAATIEELFRSWYDEVCRKRGGDLATLKSLELHVFPAIGTKPPAAVTLKNWMALLTDLAALDPLVAMHVLSISKRALAWAESLQLVSANVLAGIDARKGRAVIREQARAARRASEINPIWQAVEQSLISHSSKRFLQLCVSFVASLESESREQLKSIRA